MIYHGIDALPTIAFAKEINYNHQAMAQLIHEQFAVWRSFLEAHSAVINALERELLEEHGFPLTWYDVLVHLSEAPGQQMQHQALAGSLLLSRSGVTRLVDRMVTAGLVRREASLEDRRVSYVVLTEQGRDTLDRASPAHVRSVAEHFIQYLNAGEIPMLTSFFSRVLRGRADAES